MSKSSVPPTPNAAAAALGRLGGSANTKAQQRARKRNAQLAGRPRRVCAKCGEPVRGGHLDRALDDVCGAHGWRWQQGDRPAGRPAAAPSAAQLLVVLTAALAQASVPPAIRTALESAVSALRSN
jgi:hypothetical protein